MKKLLAVLFTLLISTSVVLAEEVQSTAEQQTDIDCAGVVVVVNKQPKTATHKQTVKVRRSGFIFILNLDGKVPTEQTKHNEVK